jgi:hypothetical protein
MAKRKTLAKDPVATVIPGPAEVNALAQKRTVEGKRTKRRVKRDPPSKVEELESSRTPELENSTTSRQGQVRPGAKKVGFVLSEDVLTALRNQAAREGVRVSELVERILRGHLGMEEL